MKHEIISDGNTVWVNSGDGVCLGRFSRFGIDVHKDFAGQLSSGTQCINCTHSRPDLKDWYRFKYALYQHYNIFILDKCKPDFLEQDSKKKNYD